MWGDPLHKWSFFEGCLWYTIPAQCTSMCISTLKWHLKLQNLTYSHRKLTYPMKIDGWKMILSFWNGPCFGGDKFVNLRGRYFRLRGHLWSLSCSNSANLLIETCEFLWNNEIRQVFPVQDPKITQNHERKTSDNLDFLILPCYNHSIWCI